jgi:ATP-dependent helicase/nuclease subunit A
MPAVDREHLKIRSIETPADVRPPTPKPADPFKLPPIRHPEQIPIGIGQVSVSSMADYQTCPKKFEYRYLKGHPGLGVGVARSSTIGTLTHQALQFDISSIEALERIAEGAPREYLAEALELADRFRTHEIFSELRNAGTEKEKPVAFKFAGVDLLGTADLVGDDIVVDYKTGGTSDAEGYKLQLWAYARALGKPRAFVAFLREPKVYEFSKNELTGAEQEAEQVLNGIASGKFEATPSYDKCSVCAYSTICPSAIIRKSITAISQPSLF